MQVEEMAGNALRCLAMAYKPAAKMGIYSTYNGPDHPAHAALTEPSTYSKVESDLTFVGIAGLMVSAVAQQLANSVNHRFFGS